MRFLDVLMDEHRGFSRMLDVLDAIAGRLERGAAVPMPMLADVLDFFENFTDRHHDKEEEMLFPLLAKHGIGPDQTVVSALMFQHEAGRVYGAKMRTQLLRLQQGEREGSQKDHITSESGNCAVPYTNAFKNSCATTERLTSSPVPMP